MRSLQILGAPFRKDRVRSLWNAIDVRKARARLAPLSQGAARSAGNRSSRSSSSESSERVQDDRDVDTFLDEGTLHWGQVAERCSNHPDDRQSDPGSDALQCDALRTAGYLDRQADLDSDRQPKGRHRQDSAEAAAPFAPIATPRSAAARAGASLTPSPIIITGPKTLSARTISIFWSGVSSQLTASSERPEATAWVTPCLSPEAITIRRNPSPRRSLISDFAPSRSSSARIKAPSEFSLYCDEDPHRSDGTRLS